MPTVEAPGEGDHVPSGANKALFVLAPVMRSCPRWQRGGVQFDPELVLANIDAGLLYIMP